MILHAGPFLLLGAPPAVVSAAATSGLILGVAPDVAAFLDRRYSPDNPNGGWQFYQVAHNGWLNRIMKWIPAWGYHTWIDRHIHPYPEHRTAYHLVEAGHWLVYSGITWCLLR